MNNLLQHWQHCLGNSVGDNCPFILHYSNITLCGRKVWSLLGDLQDDEKPHAFAFVEAHLRGADLNQARRRFASLGWASHCTPATTKADKFLGTDANCPVTFPISPSDANLCHGLSPREEQQLLVNGGVIGDSSTHQVPGVMEDGCSLEQSASGVPKGFAQNESNVHEGAGCSLVPGKLKVENQGNF